MALNPSNSSSLEQLALKALMRLYNACATLHVVVVHLPHVVCCLKDSSLVEHARQSQLRPKGICY